MTFDSTSFMSLPRLPQSVMSLSISQFNLTLAALSVTLVTLLYRLIIHPAFLSPLSKIPNAHPLAAFTHFWLQSLRSRNTDAQTILSANHIPNNGSVNGPNAHSYQHHPTRFTTPKPTSSPPPPLPPQLQPQRAETSKLQDSLSDMYSKPSVQNSLDLAAISSVVIYRRLLPLLSRKAGLACGPGEAVDAVMLMRAVAMDMGTGHMFGLDRGTEFLGKDDEEGLGRWVGESLGSLRPRERTGKGEKTRLGWAMEMLPWLAEWIGGLFGEDVVLKDAGTEAGEIARWFREMVDGAEKDLAALRAVSGTGVCPGRVPVVLRHLEESVAERESLGGEKQNHVSFAGGHDCHAVAARKQTQKTELANELLDHLIVTYDTVSTTLAYLLWQLSHNEGYQVRLQGDMMDLKEPPISYPSAIGGLPLPKDIG
ncbi:hypothetical protein LTS18_013198 [Coniosporium uncinatum]|uniref:Uncharacterized protein n=1 Tax=Coniosporium uncinatum TaxID=93489 RepID=A0ACC3D983_9PEZI|nr:hypothetical protein LTS18_013198 [Coniosporium uncinatum]